MNHVYLIKDLNEGFCKIGVAKQPEKRLKQLQTGNSAELKIVYTFESEYAYKIEKTLHRFYNHIRKMGEWFEFPVIDEQNFIQNCKKIERNFKILKEKNNPFI